MERCNFFIISLLLLFSIPISPIPSNWKTGSNGAGNQPSTHGVGNRPSTIDTRYSHTLSVCESNSGGKSVVVGEYVIQEGGRGGGMNLLFADQYLYQL